MIDVERVPAGLATDSAVAIGKASPPIAVAGAAAAGASLQQWVMIATLVYVVLQILHLAWRTVRELREDKSRG